MQSMIFSYFNYLTKDF